MKEREQTSLTEAYSVFFEFVLRLTTFEVVYFYHSLRKHKRYLQQIKQAMVFQREETKVCPLNATDNKITCVKNATVFVPHC